MKYKLKKSMSAIHGQHVGYELMAKTKKENNHHIPLALSEIIASGTEVRHRNKVLTNSLVGYLFIA